MPLPHPPLPAQPGAGGGDLGALKEEIARTVLHEVGHYFGLNEGDMVRLDIH